MNIGDMLVHFRNKERLQVMIEIFGREETIQRLAWLGCCIPERVEILMDQFLTGDYLDDRGVKGGTYFLE